MSVKIKLKHSATLNKAPQPGDLVDGELALNINAGSPAAYLKDSTGTIVKVGGGPASETASGLVELATAAETTAGADSSRAVHPAGLKAAIAAAITPGSSTPPTAPSTGATYIDSSVSPRVIKVWDGTTWVPQAGLATTGATAPVTPSKGQVWIDSGTSPAVTKIWSGTAWLSMTTDAATQAKLDAQVAPGLWSRTGTNLAPSNPGDTASFSAGTAALPGLTPVGDPNTGIYSPGADQVAVATNGIGRLFVDANGNTSLTQRLTAPLFNTAQETSANAGTNIPLTPQSGGYSLISVDNASTNLNGATFLRLGNVNAGINTSASWIGAYYNLNYSSDVYIFSGKQGNNTLAANNSALNAVFSQDSVKFYTGAAGTSNTSERLRLDSSGRLLVGTSSVSATGTMFLQGNSANSTANANFYLCRGSSPGTTSELGYLVFGDNSQNTGAWIVGRRDGGTWTSGSSHPSSLVFSTAADGASSPTERLRITSTGVLQVADAGNITVGTTAGTKIGTATTQKIGFYNKTPVVQPAAVADATDAASVVTQLNALLARMRDLGLIAT